MVVREACLSPIANLIERLPSNSGEMQMRESLQPVGQCVAALDELRQLPEREIAYPSNRFTIASDVFRGTWRLQVPKKAKSGIAT
jgi:hypothetical protein